VGIEHPTLCNAQQLGMRKATACLSACSLLQRAQQCGLGCLAASQEHSPP
jgi:hypothetical protein